MRADIDDGEIVRLYTQRRHTAAEIAERLGCSTSLVYGRLARREVERRPQALADDPVRPHRSSVTSMGIVG